ncbi:hypothetical protein NDU88_000858 [Pleurodeles waltl]|uniref:Uncharacterized protein n=1 Tax=Pleurodeles waltl TaxID=8319 RepID=A0AAV7MKX8_PLEWA|nr:hypothetical protein NDU88_000858 [Pleurodeles waltl]
MLPSTVIYDGVPMLMRTLMVSEGYVAVLLDFSMSNKACVLTSSPCVSVILRRFLDLEPADNGEQMLLQLSTFSTAKLETPAMASVKDKGEETRVIITAASGRDIECALLDALIRKPLVH